MTEVYLKAIDSILQGVKGFEGALLPYYDYYRNAKFVSSDKPNFDFCNHNFKSIIGSNRTLPISEANFGIDSIITVYGRIDNKTVRLSASEVTLQSAMLPGEDFALVATLKQQKKDSFSHFTKSIAAENPAQAFRYLANMAMRAYTGQAISIETTFFGCFKYHLKPSSQKIDWYSWPIEDIFCVIQKVKSVRSEIEVPTDKDFQVVLRQSTKSGSKSIIFVPLKNENQVKLIISPKQVFVITLENDTTHLVFINAFCYLMEKSAESEINTAVYQHGECLQDNIRVEFKIGQENSRLPSSYPRSNLQLYYNIFRQNENLTFV